MLCYVSGDTSPVFNLALEEYFTCRVSEGQVILFIWQNKKTVVIGRNQNAFRECRFEELAAAGGRLARRLSGGGAVFHDLGNVNFSFIAGENEYNVERQLDVIAAAVERLGIHAERTGRNDVTVDGRKFSGNAFYSKNGGYCHHGTIMINVDLTDMARFLSAPGGKIHSRGVESARSRVVNLAELNPGVTTDSMKNALIASFGEVYGGTPALMDESIFDRSEIERLSLRYESREWLFGKVMDFTWESETRFDWGNVQLQLTVANGVITDAAIFSDALDADFIQSVPDALRGIDFSREAVTCAMRGVSKSNRLASDIAVFITANM